MFLNSICWFAILAWPLASYGVLGGDEESGSSPRALIVDLGTAFGSTKSAMEQHGWEVGKITWDDLMQADEADLIADRNVIWILPGTDEGKLRTLAKPGAILDRFIHRGGVVVIVGITVNAYALDVLPGGIDVRHESTTGSLTIVLPSHPIISSATSGGADLSVQDLDPAGTGGGGYLGSVPEGINMEVIATNPGGVVLATYEQCHGRVVVSMVDMLCSGCLANLLGYVSGVLSTQ